MRRSLSGIALAVLLLAGVPAAAYAATTPMGSGPTVTQAQSGSLVVPIVGTNGTNAVATITGFHVVNGVLTAVGTVTGDVTTLVGGVPVTTHVVDAPFTAALTSVSGTCQILTLDVGAIHLDVLGLIVDLSPVHLNVTAQSGSGKLLGNLLCTVAHLLDNGASPNAIANLLDHILRAL